MNVFGSLPKGEHLNKVKQSKFYNGKEFINPTIPHMKVDMGVMMQMFRRPRTVRPFKPIPSVRTQLDTWRPEQPGLVWFGHSSYLMYIGGKRVLVDPVLSGHASPFSFSVKAFAGADAYKPEMIPAIDVLLLSHDHYDHLDYKTVIALRNRIGHIICPLGVAAHLRSWGFSESMITELQWWESTERAGLRFTATPAQHFSGRLFKRAQSMWASYAIESSNHRIFAGGDSGYAHHFKEINARFGSFDLAILECGQYNAAWSGIHMMPEETVIAAKELNAKLLLPVHWGKFTLAMHPWDESVERALTKAEELHQPITTPMIGEPLELGKIHPQTAWWREDALSKESAG